ncbi:MAG TPA: hypothetical protein VGP48_09010 [Stellaceae bacterium]|jgi:hypothetical protein|nr:hypothetical protein [Stellaceae bacterium]
MTTRHVLPKLLAASSLLWLAACAAPNWSAIDQQAFTIRAACERQHQGGMISSALGTERCANGSIHELYASAGYPQMDVLDRYLARREAIAAAVDRHAIPPADAHLRLAEARTEQVSALQQHGLDPAVFDTTPYPVSPVCERVNRVDTLCN